MSEQCVLIPGEFGVFVQVFIGCVSIGILITKYLFEKPRRTFLKFLKDVIVIICGSVTLHITNIFSCIFIFRYHILSYLYKIDMDECSIYFVQIIMDATLGLYVEYKLFTLFKLLKFRNEYLQNNSISSIYKPTDALSHYSSFVTFSNSNDLQKGKDAKSRGTMRRTKKAYLDPCSNSSNGKNESTVKDNADTFNSNENAGVSSTNEPPQNRSNNLERAKDSNAGNTDNALHNESPCKSVGKHLAPTGGLTSAEVTTQGLSKTKETNETSQTNEKNKMRLVKDTKRTNAHPEEANKREQEGGHFNAEDATNTRKEQNTYEEDRQYNKYKKYYNNNCEDYKNELKLLTKEPANEEVCIQINENGVDNKEMGATYENKNSEIYKKIEENYMDTDLFQNILIWVSVVLIAKFISLLIFFLLSPIFNIFVMGTIAHINDMRYKLLVVMIIVPFFFNFIMYFYMDSIVKTKNTCNSASIDKI
ncbi:conserved Plasmodium protein, unknown function [Plasmodium knowlesi strain H]|uniref:Uncharacterized protein n=3 Tax=Plasmodium knowlesi TaxID=5850 RepID=A0A5K1VNH0_PLAKH|nr:conserved Plasmodium protein, unknown function [Plasmodium knowlesi strain H]OTN66153.1 Uncharacterized protein PKNOH_S09549300 [Plasmodium knowlesi]CAA9989821.1 conserved Plasmodium protein, unknown function [Plasmodium knowlesi strain H]SBO24368.1 conserved Plasmodium protein, unknown function [Plasmodium knowlesi strain H]SBO26662.1 conserved Plasmodium protein, unknown function [Plasmodium knowlesi strain H]VVS79295.1 conserved Plasmodium protein, unknown function [Plasmodium knowlesi s|eukprot:XP_002259836.1 hypothetical protein, conserved in Plasmodium species [Plasmodium knowlesi strain H]